MPDEQGWAGDEILDGEQLVLGDLISRVLDKGLVISGHVVISVADIDLIALDLRLVLSSVQTAMERMVGSTETGHADARVLPAEQP